MGLRVNNLDFDVCYFFAYSSNIFDCISNFICNSTLHYMDVVID